MKFRSALFLAASVAVLGCGTEPDPGVEKTEAALTAISYPNVYLDHQILQQVPITCAPTDCNGATGQFDGPDAWSLPAGAFGAVTGNPGGIWNVAVRGATSPGINAVAHATLFNWSIGYNNTARIYFPANWNLPQGPNNFGMVSFSESAADASGYWTAGNATIYVYWTGPSLGIPGTGPTTSNATYMAVRVDVPFPAYGVTNRWFYFFTR